MLPRFLVPGLGPDARTVFLPEDEARHLTRVLRLDAGDEVAVFDGTGHEYRARVLHAARERVEVELVEAIEPAAEPRVRLTLVQAVIKGDRMDDVVRDATMMGVAAIQPILSAHTAVPLDAVRRGRPVARWRRVAVASAKQCRRATLPSVEEVADFATWLAAPFEGARLLLVEPAATGAPPGNLRALARPAHAAVVVGPEGGWAAAEITAAVAAGCVPVTLGHLTLRADAVAVAALAVIRFLWDEP